MKMKKMMAVAVLLMAPAVWAVKTPGLGSDDSGPLRVAQDIQSLPAITQV
jgi:hypothetical protein